MRNNEKRTGQSGAVPPESPAAAVAATQPQGLSFVAPTEFVELPSRGELYPKDHPLHKQAVVEIKYMTAREEDNLSSSNLIKKGGTTEVKIKIKDGDEKLTFKLKDKRLVDRKSLNKLKKQDILTTIH